MREEPRDRDGAIRRIVCDDRLPAIFAVAVYLQLHAVLGRFVPFLPEDELLAASLLGVVLLRFRWGVLATAGPRRLALACAPWLLAGLLSGIDASSASDWRKEMTGITSWALMGVLLASLFATRRALLVALYAVVGAGAVVGALNTHQFLTSSWDFGYLGLAGAQFQNIHGRVDGYRAIGPASDPNYHAQFLLPLLAIAVERTWNARGRARLLAAAATTFLGCGLLLTYSRGALLASAVLVPIGLLGAWRWRVPAAGLALTLAAAIVGVAVAGPSLFARLGTLPLLNVLRDSRPESGVGVDAAVRGRLSENLAAIHMFRDHPWNGIGLGCFHVHYHEYATRIGLDERIWRHPHSLYLQTASESGLFGVIGLVFLLAMLSTTLSRTRRGLLDDGDVEGVRRLWGIGMALLAYLLTAVFLHLSFQAMLWTLLAFGFSTPLLRRDAQLPRDP